MRSFEQLASNMLQATPTCHATDAWTAGFPSSSKSPQDYVKVVMGRRRSPITSSQPSYRNQWTWCLLTFQSIRLLNMVEPAVLMRQNMSVDHNFTQWQTAASTFSTSRLNSSSGGFTRTCRGQQKRAAKGSAPAEPQKPRRPPHRAWSGADPAAYIQQPVSEHVATSLWP